MREIAVDEETGLKLVADTRDPPRFYLSRAKRVDLLSIGDLVNARKLFSRKIEEVKTSRERRRVRDRKQPET